MATPMTTMPRGNTTNWKRMVFGDSFGTSEEGGVIVIRKPKAEGRSLRLLFSSPRSIDHEVRQIALELRRRVGYDDGVLVANRLAQAAGHALVLVDEGQLVVIGDGLVVRFHHVDAFERTDIDAELAPRAELLDHLGFGDVFRLDPGNVVAVLVLDGIDRAVNAADGAIDAACGVDVELPLLLTPDGVRRAFDLANAASN